MAIVFGGSSFRGYCEVLVDPLTLIITRFRFRVLLSLFSSDRLDFNWTISARRIGRRILYCVRSMIDSNDMNARVRVRKELVMFG